VALQDSELTAEAELLDLVLEEALDRLCERVLHLADAHSSEAGLTSRTTDHQLGEEVGLHPSTTAMEGLVPRGLEEWTQDLREATLPLELELLDVEGLLQLIQFLLYEFELFAQWTFFSEIDLRRSAADA
jgi:hypothetical protein